jgi:uncharacterized membrane protein
MIRNPVVWTWEQVRAASVVVEGVGRAERTAPGRLIVHRITYSDLRTVLAKGVDDFNADPTHYVFLCALYPVIGFLLWKLVIGAGSLELFFPLISGFALIGPIAAVGIYEMSRRREAGAAVSWTDAFLVLRSPGLSQIIKLALLFTAIFVVWLLAADLLYRFTLGRLAPQSAGIFFDDIFTTVPGWAMLIVGNLLGFCFAMLALVLGTVSFQAVLDLNVSAETALRASIRVAQINPGPVALWGLIVAVSLALGTITLLIGLALALPILSHASWHLYRRLISA